MMLEAFKNIFTSLTGRGKKSNSIPFRVYDVEKIQKPYYHAEGSATDSNWIYYPLLDSKDELVQYRRQKIVANSRHFERNSPLLSRLADIFEEFVTGKSGIRFQSASSNMKYNEQTQSIWNKWIEKSNFASLQSVIARTWFVDGEIFIVKTLDNGVRDIKLYETQNCTGADERQNVIEGIKYDSNWKPIQYYFKEGRKLVCYDASDVIHVFTPIRANQLRGLPYAYSVLERLAQLESIVDFELKSAESFSEKAGFIKPATGEAPDIGDEIRDSLRKTVAQKAENTELAENDKRFKALRETLGGRLSPLAPGEDFIPIVSNRPSTNFLSFYKIIVNDICSGCGIGKIMYDPESLQGTVTRATIEVNKSFVEGHIALLSEKLKGVFRHIVAGVPIFGTQQRWNEVMVKEPRSIIVDMGREQDKEIIELDAGLKAYEDACNERGLDWEYQVKRIANEKKKFIDTENEFGLPPGSIAKSMSDLLKKETTNNTEKKGNTNE